MKVEFVFFFLVLGCAIIEYSYNSSRRECSNQSCNFASTFQDGEHLSKEKNGVRPRNRGRGRRQKNRGTNGHGITKPALSFSYFLSSFPIQLCFVICLLHTGHGTTSSCHAVEPSKPPPGPRMPDGTRGFTMGRGRPLISKPSQ